jgi:serine/threonine-protein kinase
MAGSPSDRRDSEALVRADDARAGKSSTDTTATEVLPGRSTLLLDEAAAAEMRGESTGRDRSDQDPAFDEAGDTVEGRGPIPGPIGPIPAAPSVPALRPRGRTRGSTSRPGSGPGTSSSDRSIASFRLDESRFTSALDALRHDEIRRSRLLARFGLLMGSAVAVALLFLPAEPGITRITYAAIGLATLGNLWLYYLASRPERFSSRSVSIVWIMNSVAVSTGVLYFGVFSAGPIVVLLGIYFLALGQSLPLAIAVYAVCAGIQGGVALLSIFGVISEPGLVKAAYLGREVLLILEGLIQLVLLAAFVMARASRRATLSAVTDYERVVRALAQREALLQEARQDLERALQLGGVGRFTGQTLGSFRLGPVLGRGSMGEVYEAAHTGTGEPAAVKLLQPNSMGNPSYLMRFLREVEVASTLEVPHVVRVLEVGNASAPVPYLAMERLRGQDLAQILREQRRLTTEQVIDLVDQVGRGITAAAGAGIVHRDLKPQNLFHADQPAGPPIWKVLDFGVSKLLGDRGTLTQGQVVGTPVYMAPEQAQGLEVDQQADLYALAAIAYRCITGHLPFRAKDVPTIMYQVVYKMPIRPSALCEVPEDVDSVLVIAMAKNPADRFASAHELAVALEDGLRGRLSDELRARARDLARQHPWRGGP